MSTWIDWKNNESPSYHKFVDYLEGICEDNMNILDTSVSDFILKCYDEGLYINRLIRLQALGFLLTSTFGNLQSVVDIITNDEGWQKWSNLDKWNKDIKESLRGGHDLSELWDLCIHRTFVDVNGNSHNANDVKPNVDFSCCTNLGKPFIMMYGEGFVPLVNLTDDQKKLYTCVCPFKNDSDFGPEFRQELNSPHMISRCGLTSDGLYDVELHQSLGYTGIYVPINKIHPDSDVTISVALPKDILEKYNIPIKE